MTAQTGTVSGVTAYELAQAEPGFKLWFNTRKTSNVNSLQTLTSFIGTARRVANENGLEMPFRAMTPEQVGELNAAMKKRGLSTAIFVALRGFFMKLRLPEQAECITTNTKKSRMRPDSLVSVEEQNKMLESCTNLRDRAVLAVLYETGMRIHEACALKLRDVSTETHNNGTEHKLVKLWVGKTKTQGQERSNLLGVEASVIVLAWVRKYPANIKGGAERPLFPSHSANNYGGHTKPDSWSVRVREIAKRAGLSDERTDELHPHLWRHTRATNLARAGVPEATIKQLMGWTPTSTVLGQYAHMAAADGDNAILVMNGFDQKRVKVEPIKVPVSEVPAMPPQWTPGNVNLDALVEKKVRALLGMRTEESLDGSPGD